MNSDAVLQNLFLQGWFPMNWTERKAMSTEQSRIEAIFFAAIEKNSPEERAAYLDQACGADRRLRERVEELLRAESDASAFLHSSGDDEPVVGEGTGVRIGPYRLLEKIGEGGFGVVYLAEQTEPIRRRVALKIVKPGMDTREVVRRFETERQALALMEHPFIARVLDAGSTDSGRPYFVMEHVEGVHITEYCDQHHLSIPQRLALFVQVCQAVQHAHQKGIIHRDLKPSNILITTQDGNPVPRIIDFGVAKALNQGLTAQSLVTIGKQMLGTPLYMSPEQAEMNSLDVDTRSDIYSLGALLYELLTGTTPFTEEQVKKAGYDELRRMIRDELPPTPSSRISTLGETASMVAERRLANPRSLSVGIRGDLDWIVMTALEKDRTRRYQTASAMATDIERHLTGMPVEARPPSPWYRLQKFTQRNSGLLIAVVAILIVGLVGLTISTLLIAQQRNVAQQATNDAQREREFTEQALERAEAAEARATEEKENAELREYYRTIEVAAARLKDNRKGDVYDLLMTAPEQYRNWEWGYLLSQCQGEVHRVPAHPLCTNSFDLSPDEKWLVSVSEMALTGGEYQVALWNAETMKEKWRRDVDYRPASVEIHPDNTVVAVGGWDCPLFIYDLETGEGRHELSPSCRRFHLCFSPDGELLVEPDSKADALTVRRTQDWEPVASFGEDMTDSVLSACMAFSPDGRYFASGNHKGKIVVWDVETWKPDREFQGYEGGVTDLVFDSTSKHLVSAGRGNRVSVWDVEGQNEARDFTLELDPGGPATWLALAPDDSKLLVAGWGGTLWCLRFSDGEALGKLRTTDTIQRFACSFELERMYFSDGRGGMSSWRLDSILDARLQEEPLGTQEGSGVRVSYSSDGKRLFGHSTNGGVEIWDTANFERVAKLQGNWDGRVKTPQFRPRTREVLMPVEGAARLYRVPETKVVAEIPLDGTLESASIDASGRYGLVGVAGSKYQKLWDLETRQVVAEEIPYPSNFGGHIGAIAGDGTRAIVGAMRMTDVSVYRLPDIKALYVKEGDDRLSYGGTRTLAFHPDNRTFALGDSTGYIYIRTTDSDDVLGMFIAENKEISCLAFSPDGTRLISGGADGVFQLWDWKAGQELLSFPQPTAPGFVPDAAFSPDGMSIVMTGVDPPFRVLKALPWGEMSPTVRDLDRDGLTDAEEARIGTEPTIADTEPPSVRLGAPGEIGELFGGEQLTFTADIIDDGRVMYADLLVDGELASSDCLAPYEFEWIPPIGARTFELAVVATDTNENIGKSKTRRMEVLPDPYTKAVGRVRFADGRPVPGARVTTAFGKSVITGQEGEFSIPDVKTVYGDIVLRAGSEQYWGESAPAQPVRKGVTQVDEIVLAEPVPCLAQTLTVGQSPCGLATCDLNRDGYQDIVTGHWESPSLFVFLGNGRGTFGPEFQTAPLGHVFSMVAADMNDDDIPDIVTANVNRDDVAVLLGIGNGTFEDPVFYDVGDNPISVAVADFNDDHDPDIVTANLQSNDVSVLVGTAGGGFKEQQRYSVGDAPASVVVLDLDHDGMTDLTVANRESDDLSVLLGLGDATFKAGPSLKAGTGPTFILAAGLNGDEIPDLAVANRKSDDVSILIGKSAGGFEETRTFPLGQSPRTLALADLNRDGLPDIVTSNFDSNSVSFLLGKGDGTFDVLEPWESQQPCYTRLYEPEYGDQPLLLTTYQGGNTVSLLSPGPVNITPSDTIEPRVLGIPCKNPEVLAWSTFLGGEEAEIVSAVSADRAGNLYVAGLTSSPDFPVTSGTFDETHNGPPGFEGDSPEYPGDAYLAKFDGRTGDLLFATFLGGSGQEGIRDILVIDSGEILIAGMTTSSDFPTTPGAYDESHNGDIDVFVAKLNANGSALVYSTFLGGAGTDQMPIPEQTRIAVDTLENVYLTGETSSADFPTTPGAYQPEISGAGVSDAFVAKLSADGTTLHYSTFLGGADSDDAGYAVHVDHDGQAYVVGMTKSTDFPATAGVYQEAHNGGQDAFVTKLTADGKGLVYSTFLGESANDAAVDILLDTGDDVYVAGSTQSDNFPTTTDAYDELHNGDDDIFVLKMNTTGTALLASTLLGGSGNDSVGASLSRDALGNIWVSGSTDSPDVPLTRGALHGRSRTSHIAQLGTSMTRLALSEPIPPRDRPYVAQLDASLTKLLYATFLDGGVPGLEEGFSVADGFGNIFVAGATMNADFPVTKDAFDTTFGGDGTTTGDAFVVKLYPRPWSTSAAVQRPTP